MKFSFPKDTPIWRTYVVGRDSWKRISDTAGDSFESSGASKNFKGFIMTAKGVVALRPEDYIVFSPTGDIQVLTIREYRKKFYHDVKYRVAVKQSTRQSHNAWKHVRGDYRPEGFYSSILGPALNETELEYWGRELRNARNARLLSIKNLAKSLQIGFVQVQRFERGYHKPGEKTRRKLIEIFDLPDYAWIRTAELGVEDEYDKDAM